MLKLLKLAAEYSLPNDNGMRTFIVGAVGIRQDGKLVHSKNEAVFDTHSRDKKGFFYQYKRFPEAHAESRLVKKIDFGATIYVARVIRSTGVLAMARPCETCQAILKAFKVDKVYYTISDNEWGCWSVKKSTDTYYSR
jgi:tRNA(Arg) A34 adenosine deaminase TadA